MIMGMGKDNATENELLRGRHKVNIRKVMSGTQCEFF